MTGKTVAQLVQEARTSIENRTPDQVEAELAAGRATLVDIRDTPELANGVIPTAAHASRGMAEFYAHPGSPYHKPEPRPEARVILRCGSGGRSALAVQTLRALRYNIVANREG